MNKKWLKQLAELFYPLAEVALYEGDQWTEIYNPLSQKKEAPSQEMGLFSVDGGQKRVLRIPMQSGCVEITFDTSLFHAITEKLSPLLATTSAPPHHSPREQILETIHSFLREKQITLANASRSNKRQMVLKLYQQGFFDIKDGSKIIADLLQTSRSTIYNYLSWAQKVKKIEIHQVDAFTDKQFGGNPAGVVLDAAGLDDEMMKKITREMNLSETAFVLPSATGDFRLRYFTPSGDEVIFCGHSTVGALHMIAKDKAEGHYSYSVETKAGLLHMEATVGHDDTIQVAYEAPPIDLKRSQFSHEEIAEGLGIPLSIVDTTKPVMFEKTNQDLFLTIQSLTAIKDLQVDFLKATAFAKSHGIIAFCLLTTETIDPVNHAHIRCFAPGVGIPEDPFTGSVQGGLAMYLSEHRMVKKGEISVEQGHEMGRPGSVRISFDGRSAIIHARAIHFFSTEIDLL